MKIALAALGMVVAASVLASPVAQADPNQSGTTGHKIVINGRQQQPTHGDDAVSCGLSVPPNPISGVPQGTSTYRIVCARTGTARVADFLDTTPLQVMQIGFTDADGTDYLLDPKQASYHVGGSDARITKDGNTFKITGHIAPYMTARRQELTDATPVTFEFNATCPRIFS